eukprot:208150_1
MNEVTPRYIQRRTNSTNHGEAIQNNDNVDDDDINSIDDTDSGQNILTAGGDIHSPIKSNNNILSSPFVALRSISSHLEEGVNASKTDDIIDGEDIMMTKGNEYDDDEILIEDINEINATPMDDVNDDDDDV